MHHLIWHALLHLGVHAAKHLDKYNRHTAPSEPACAKCGSKHDLKTRNCCGVILCEGHAAQWRQLVSENGYLCIICDKPCVFRN